MRIEAMEKEIMNAGCRIEKERTPDGHGYRARIMNGKFEKVAFHADRSAMRLTKLLYNKWKARNEHDRT